LSGALASSMRYEFRDLPTQKRQEEIHARIADNHTNVVTIKSHSIGNLNTLQDTSNYRIQYTVKNEVLQIGEINSFKIPFQYVFVKPDAFTEPSRETPLSYWNYENVDQYRDVVNIELPAGKTFNEVPKDAILDFKGMTYQLKYVQSAPGILKVTRAIKVEREDIAVADYPAWRTFVEAILEAEARHIAFK
jgi:hypothetical protein